MKDLMVDIESLGTAPSSVITQIGALYFDRDTGCCGDYFSVNIQIQDSLNKGLTVDGGALKFWFGQSGRSFLESPVPLLTALGRFSSFYKKGTLAWSHATFDFPLLASVYGQVNQKFCIPYRNLRDIRTLVDLSKIPYQKKAVEGTDPKTHDALEDCKYQVGYCVKCFAKFKNIK